MRLPRSEWGAWGGRSEAKAPPCSKAERRGSRMRLPQRELGDVLARGLKDPRITGFITVTGAKMAPDLKDVTVYVSIHGEAKTRDETLEGLRAAAGYLQREVARRIHLRYTPHLRFAYDGS